MELDLHKNKNTFIDSLLSTQRPGIDNLLGWLEGSDFFTAPASTRFHSCYKGGLVHHSINVMNRLLQNPNAFTYAHQTLILVSLLHDICKAYFYTTEKRWRKDESNKWEQYESYGVNELFPYGHGEKSVFIANQFIKLRQEEAMAIRWHMGAFENQKFGEAIKHTPLCFYLHNADMESTWFDGI